MEVDSDSNVEQSLLLQFGCLGTRDKDDLIKQFMVLTNDSVTLSTASFFLEMNSWNLQAAVCSFFDFGVPERFPSMALQEQRVPDKACPPNTLITVEWILLNNGEEYWPQGCAVYCIEGNYDISQNSVLEVKSVGPRCTTNVVTCFFTPSEPGIYKSRWRMALPSRVFFGDVLNLCFEVCHYSPTMEEEDTELCSQLNHRMTLTDSSEQTDNQSSSPDSSGGSVSSLSPFDPSSPPAVSSHLTSALAVNRYTTSATDAVDEVIEIEDEEK